MPQSQKQSQNSESGFSYRPTPGLNDEVFGSDGTMREHWEQLLASFEGMGSRAFAIRESKALRILRDDGATYNVYSELDKSDRTWSLDLVPALIDSNEWGSIEAGLLERAELLNLLLKDIYSERQLIRLGVIPPEALFCHQGFFRACHGISLPGEHDLILQATDLIRNDDGEFCILSDRVQNPSGAGYALENRTVMSRIFPSLYRHGEVHRLAPFFLRLRNTLNTLSPNQDQPRVVVLTPGAHNETYFEHAYIANYLGFHLVQSGDLVVRNGYVWMKSLDGLSRVDVILRRVDDWFCDPVELRSDSQLGIANLLEVARAGNVAIANPLGSGILENPVFLRYLPEIAKALLGRELRLPSIKTYWCGVDEDLKYVLDKLDTLVIKQVDRLNGQRSIFGSRLDSEQLADLRKQIQRSPMQFVAQPLLAASHLPTAVDASLQPRPAILRSFAVASGGSYTLMPGGLTRVGNEVSAAVISNQAGAKSKDTWVIASEPEIETGGYNDEEPALVARDAELMSLPSRVVENLFWMGRYTERAESCLRLLRTVFMLLNGEEPISNRARKRLLETVTELTATHPGFLDDNIELIADPEQELLRVVSDGSRLGSVKSTLNSMLACAEESQELLSSDTFRVINDIRDALGDLNDSLSGGMASAPEEALDPLVTALMALAGLNHESMVRGIGWRFIEIGRRLERATQTTALMKKMLVDEMPERDQNMMIQALLLTMESLISYRRRYRARMGVQSTLDLVLMDTSNPRSLLYQVEQLRQHTEALPRGQDNRHELSPEERTVLEAETLLKCSVLTELNAREDGHRVLLRNKLERVVELLASLSIMISDRYFDHREVSRQLIRNTWGSDT